MRKPDALRVRFLFGLALCLIVFSATPVRADSIMLNISGPGTASFVLLGNGTSAGWMGISFNLTQTFYNVTINAPSLGPAGSGTYYLTNSLGPGTTSANIVASLPFSSRTTNTIFSGLTLDPGYYYFTVITTAGSPPAVGYWSNAAPPTFTTAPGVSYGAMWFMNQSLGINWTSPLESNWYGDGGVQVSAPLEVTGSPVPEPSTLVMLGLGLGGLATRLRQRRKVQAK